MFHLESSSFRVDNEVTLKPGLTWNVETLILEDQLAAEGRRIRIGD